MEFEQFPSISSMKSNVTEIELQQVFGLSKIRNAIHSILDWMYIVLWTISKEHQNLLEILLYGKSRQLRLQCLESHGFKCV